MIQRLFIFTIVSTVIMNSAHAADQQSNDATLYQAASNGNIALLKDFIATGHDINTPLRNPQFPQEEREHILHIAIRESYACNQNHLPHHKQAKHNATFAEFFKELLAINTININIQDAGGWAPLHHVVIQSDHSVSSDLLKTLLSSPRININICNNQGKTALHLAASTQNIAASLAQPKILPAPQLLINAGISLHTRAKDKKNSTALDLCPEINTSKKILINTLFKAIKDGNIADTKRILRQIPFTIKDDNGNTILHHAVKSGNKDIIGLFYALKPSFIAVENNQGETPVSLAIGHQPIFNLLYNGLAFPPTNVLALEENKDS